MLKFDWTINLGEVLTTLTILATFAYRAGFIQRTLIGLQGSLDVLKADFDAHTQQDVDRFNEVNRNIVTISAAHKD